jgi:hypothetical protein
MSMEHRRAVCDYCRLPLPSGWWDSPASARDQGEETQRTIYCCLGCRMAAAIVDGKDTQGVPRAMIARLGLSVFFTMNVMAFTMALWSTDVY